MWRYEQEFRIDKPETEGETDKCFDLDNYKDWLEEQLTNCRKQLSIHIVSNSIATEYAEFCVRCDREKLPLLCLEDYIKQYCN